jgi:replicative DNA helicase
MVGYDIEIEKQLLGVLLGYETYQEEILLNTDANLFYDTTNKLVYNTITKLVKDNKGVDIMTVTMLLRGHNDLEAVGGAYYISSLVSLVGSGANCMTHVRILKELFIKRSMFQLFNEGIQDLGTDKDIFDIFNKFNSDLEKLFVMKDSNIFNMYDIIVNRLEQISEIKQGELIGIDSGLHAVNENTGGWQDGDIIILAARPSMGKTALSLYFAKYPAIVNDANVLYFSLEMSKERIADRLISLETGINSKKIQTNNLYDSDWSVIDAHVGKFSDKDFNIIDEGGLTVEEIKNIAILENKKKEVDFIVIDYLQLIGKSTKGNTNDQVAHISLGLKNLAKKMKCPIMVLSQLKRIQKEKPELSDLRDSGAIEQDADVVIFIHRYDYENKTCEPEQNNLIELNFAKHRNGELGTVEIYRADDWSKFFQSSEMMPEF